MIIHQPTSLVSRPPMRLGFAVRLAGRPELRPPTGQRGEPPHLSLWLAHLGDVLAYLRHIGVTFYRCAPPLAGDLATIAGQVGECAEQLDLLAASIAAQDLRLSLHLDHGTGLAAGDERAAAEALAHIEAHALLLAALEGNHPGVIVTHIGGSPTDPQTLARFQARYRALSARARNYLAIEHDAAFSLGTLLGFSQHCGVPVVFDLLHWQRWNPEALPPGLALGLALATWPTSRRAEVHLSSQRSEAHLLPPRAGQPARILPPRPGQHADFINPHDLISLIEAARGLPPFDIMIEAKAGDLALLRLRSEFARLAPNLASRLG